VVRRIDGYNVLENVLAHDDRLCKSPLLPQSGLITHIDSDHTLAFVDIITDNYDDLSTIDPNLIISQSGDRKHSQLKILSRTQADNLLRGTCRTYPEACEEVGDGQSINDGSKRL
jgi:hypothetical protein